jgi:predicted ArsR family transcriptional regulator
VAALALESGTATAQQVAKRTGIDHSMVRDVLLRLVDSGVVVALPRATSRAPQYYEAPAGGSAWLALVHLARLLIDLHSQDPAPAVRTASP